ncbi:MAG TPA: hypothetical protein VE153_13615 [Myxococcus sp.]|nr:hypothetical protein [Myxococcus sp.]
MSRIESASGTPVPLDTSSEPVTASAKEPSTPAPAARNQVGAYDGPPVPRAPAPAPRQAPSSSGPAVSAGELAALGGRLRPASPDVPGELYAGIQSHLTRGLGHWAITDGDVKSVHTALGTLPPGGYRAALERMERDGLLQTYLKEQDAPARLAFLEQAESKGMLQRLKGAPASGPLGYPGEPDFFGNDSKLPGSMRDAVNAHAIQAGLGFYRAHAEYLDRYVDAASGAKSLAALRDLGHPRDASLSDRALGLERGDPERERYAREWRQAIGTPVSRNRAYQAVSARQQELLGQRSAGTLQVSGEASVSRQSLKVGGEALLDTRGRVDMKTKGGFDVKAGPLSLEAMSDTKGGTQSELTVEVGPVSVSQSSDGVRKLKIGRGEHLGAFVSLNPHEAEFGGGVFAKAERGDSGAEVEAGFSMKGLRAGQAGEAIDPRRPGLFTPPPELGAGTAWDALPEHRRALLTRDGWSREEWTRKLAR